MHIHQLARSVIVALLLAAGCGGEGEPETPRSTISSDLAGAWFTGTLSTIQYYDRDSGEWLDPSGEGFYFIFGRDGSYETGAVINSTVAGCTMRLLGNETGTIVQDGDELTVYRHRIKTHVENSCGNDGERTQGEATRLMSYFIEEDENGLPWLHLVHEDGSVERYRPWD